MVPAGNKAKRLLSVNRTTKTIHHHHRSIILLALVDDITVLKFVSGLEILPIILGDEAFSSRT